MSHREVLDDGSIDLAKDGCSFVFRRLRPGAVLVTIAGRDTGSLGDAPLTSCTRSSCAISPAPGRSRSSSTSAR
ncbi:hypothetical protein [Sorangium sp. So ce388]|uniref:hypothetical protein n=1 Tax=Sorangium sp. So ce388 TaxID=3133309 RepID=UPI003F5B84D8